MPPIWARFLKMSGTSQSYSILQKPGWRPQKSCSQPGTISCPKLRQQLATQMYFISANVSRKTSDALRKNSSGSARQKRSKHCGLPAVAIQGRSFPDTAVWHSCRSCRIYNLLQAAGGDITSPLRFSLQPDICMHSCNYRK